MDILGIPENMSQSKYVHKSRQNMEISSQAFSRRQIGNQALNTGT